MPKNTKGGSGHKRMKNNGPPILKNVQDLKKSSNSEDFEFYGKCIKPLGNRRFEVLAQAPNNTTVTLHCRLAGSCRKKIQKDAFVLVQLFPFNLTQGQIANVYDSDDVNALKKAGVWDFITHEDDPFEIENENEKRNIIIEDQDQDHEIPENIPAIKMNIDDNVI